MVRISSSEPRYIRITDFGEDGIQDGHTYATADPLDLKYGLAKGDILFARSGATVGKTYVHEDDSVPAVFAGYCIRFCFDVSSVSPMFVYWWTKTPAYLRWVESVQRPSGQPNINKEEFKSVPIPLPSFAVQSHLIDAMGLARKIRRTKLTEADALLAGIEDFVLDALGIRAPSQGSHRVFAVRRRDTSSRDLGPSAYTPELQRVMKSIGSHYAASNPLRTYVDINPRIDIAGLDGAQTVGFLPMASVSDGATGDFTLEQRPLAEVRKGYTPFNNGDILWAKITPCMQNGKSCLVNELPNGIGFGSTEFHVLRVLAAGVLPEFVREFVSQQAVRRAATYAFTGSAGQQRVPATFLASLPFPLIPEAQQKEIVDSIAEARAHARRLRAEAEGGWQDAKQWFEEQLLGPESA